VVNDSVTAYKLVTDLKTVLTDSLGVSMSAKYFNLVVWGSVSEDAADSQLMINLPSASYNTSADAQTDIDDTADYTIPATFRGTGFLVARLTMRHQTAGGGTWTEVLNTDLRGLFASTSVGGSTGSGLTQAEADTLYLQLIGGTVSGALTVQGSFTSIGIDDNATAERVQISDTNLNIGASRSTYSILNAVNDQQITLSGGNSSNSGANIRLDGGTHASTGDMAFRNDANTWMLWDESVGDLIISAGIGVKTQRMQFDGAGDILFGDGASTPTGEVTLRANGTAYAIELKGGSAGSSITLYGSTNGAVAYDWNITSQNGANVEWDNSTGIMVLSSGTTPADALTLNATQDASFAGQISAIAGTTSKASINIPTGVSKTSPVQGDFWVTASDAFIRLNGVSQSIINTGSGAPVDSVFGRTGVVVAISADYSSFYPPINNAVFTGTFATVGIDDNASAERLELNDTTMLLGVTTLNTNYIIGRRTQQGRLTIYGGTGSTGPNLVLHGPSDISDANDFELGVGSGQVIKWDESLGMLTFRSGTGTKNVALTIDANQHATFAEKVIFDASTTADPSFNIPEGVAPTSPVDGDMWVTTTDILARISGVSRSLIDVAANSLDGTHMVDKVFGDWQIGQHSGGTNTGTSYVKVGEMYIKQAGTYRTRIRVWVTGTDGPSASARVYKNGSAIGTVRNGTTNGASYNQDFTGIVVGDLIQLYVKANSGSSDGHARMVCGIDSSDLVESAANISYTMERADP